MGMSSQRRVDAFSLVQIIFALAVVAIIISLSVAGISLLRKSSRESNRKTLGGNFVSAVNDYKRINLRYPQESEVVFSAEELEIGGKKILDLSSELSPAETTTASGTRYFYQSIDGKFSFCILMESGVVESFGDISCPDLNTW